MDNEKSSCDLVNMAFLAWNVQSKKYLGIGRGLKDGTGASATALWGRWEMGSKALRGARDDSKSSFAKAWVEN